jgi:hypothetical protein
LPADHPVRDTLLEAAERHTLASLPHIASGHYEGQHGLASFALYMLSEAQQLTE